MSLESSPLLSRKSDTSSSNSVIVDVEDDSRNSENRMTYQTIDPNGNYDQSLPVPPAAIICVENGSSHEISSETSRQHCHTKQEWEPSQENVSSSNLSARKTIIAAGILCLFFMVGEIVGGYIAGSLAIMTDAAHLLTDFASFLISLFSLFVASRRPSKHMSFGWHRAEVLGAFLSVLLIWIVTGVLVYIAIERIINKNYDIDGKIMLITAAVGVGVNIIMGIILHSGSHSHGHSHGHSHSMKRQEHISFSDSIDGDEQRMLDDSLPTVGYRRKLIREANINVRAAFIHVIGDLLQSLGVLIAAYVIYYKPELAVIDPICTFIFSALVLGTTLAVMKDAVNVLMEGMPRGLDFQEVAASLLALEGVIRVHDLRIWSLTMDKIALSVHLAINTRFDPQVVLKNACDMIKRDFHVYECTVQIEYYSDDMDACMKCEHPAS